MTKKALLFAGFALIGSSVLICSSALANSVVPTVPTEYKDWLFDIGQETKLTKRISDVISEGKLKDGVKFKNWKDQIIKATPLYEIWSENAMQKALRAQMLELTLKALVNHHATIFSQAHQKLIGEPGGGPGSETQLNLLSLLGKVTHGTEEYRQIARQLKAVESKAREIVEQVENTRSHLKEDLEAGLEAGGMPKEEIEELRKMTEKADLKLEDFIPAAGGVHVGFKIPELMMQTLRQWPLFNKLAKDADGSFMVSYLFQPWEVEVITHPLLAGGTTQVEKYIFIKGNKHLWANRNKIKGVKDPSEGRGINIRGGISFISGDVEDLRNFLGGFLGVSFDTKSRIMAKFGVDASINVKAGTLITTGNTMAGNHYLMISPQIIGSGTAPATAAVKKLTNDIAAVFEITRVDQLRERLKGFVARSQLRFSHGAILPLSSDALATAWDSLLDTLMGRVRDSLMGGVNQSSQGAPPQ